MRIVTHSGNYHTDDVFAVATLLLVYSEAEVIRSRDDEVIKSADVAVDVGGEYDPSRRRFDHHQPGGAGKRENGIPYASFGLVWKEFGERIAGGKEEAEIIDRELVVAIDAIDNGVEVSTPVFEDVRIYNIGDFLKSYKGDAETMAEFDAAFNKAMHVAKELLERELAASRGIVKDWQEAKHIYDGSKDKRIIILPKHVSWKKVLIPTEAIYVISQGPDEKWQVSAVPIKLGGFTRKKPFPESWAGRRDAELAELTGVPDAVFTHRGLFLTVAESKEGAIRLAETALNS